MTWYEFKILKNTKYSNYWMSRTENAHGDSNTDIVLFILFIIMQLFVSTVCFVRS